MFTKRIFTLLALLLALQTASHAQQFAPVGAEWFLDANHGIFHAQITKDTVILSRNCRKVTYTPHIDSAYSSYGFHLDTPLPLYVYDTPDTVFIYNRLFQKFTPLYAFNINDGDTVTLPVLPPNDGCAGLPLSNLGDSTFSIFVDSVRTVSYGTASLQTVYTHPLIIAGNVRMTFPAYARMLGHLDGGLLPNCESCVVLASENCAGPGAVRCYSDSTHSIKLVTGDCAKGINLSVPGITRTENEISIYPNPTGGLLHIQNSTPVSITRAQIVSVDGRVIKEQQEAPVQSLNLQDVQPGFYFIRLFLKNEQTVLRTVVKQ